MDILLYYWDDRDGQAYSGWWFGRQLGGQQVWGHCNSHAQTPPADNWKIPWDGPVEESLRVQPESEKQETEARIKLEALKNDVKPLVSKVKKAQEKARLASNRGKEDEIQKALADLQETAEEMKEIKGQAASIPVPRQKLDSISILEELQEFRNRLADCCQRLDTEAASLQKQQKEIEDAALRQEEAQETQMLLPDFISSTLMLANEAEDLVEKAQITKTMVASCEEDFESATQALDQLQTAVAAAQFGLDSAKTSLQEKEAEIENLPPFAHEGAREELLRLRQQIQQAQVTLQPLKTTRQDWERRRTSQKVIAQVEQKLVLAEVEAEQTAVMLKDINATEVISQELLGDAKKAVRSVERTTTAASSHLNSRRALLQNTPLGQKELEVIQPRLETVQSQQCTLEEQLRNLEDKFLTGGYLAEATAKLEALREALQNLEATEAALDEDDQEGALKSLQASETLAAKVQQDLSVVAVFLQMKSLEVKRLTTEAGEAAAKSFQDLQQSLSGLKEQRSELSSKTAQRRANMLLREAVRQVEFVESAAADMAASREQWAKDDCTLSPTELSQATSHTMSLEKAVNKALAEARKLLACRQIDARSKGNAPALANALTELQGRLAKVQSDVSSQRKLYQSVEQRAAQRRLQAEVKEKLSEIEGKLVANEIIASKFDKTLSMKSALVEKSEDIAAQVKGAEASTQEVHLALRGLARQLESRGATAASALEQLRSVEQRAQQTQSKLKEHSESLFVHRILQDAEQKKADCAAAFDKVSKRPWSESNLEAAEVGRLLTEWEKAIQTTIMMASNAKTDVAMKRLALKRITSDVGVKGLEALNGAAGEVEGVGSRLAKLKGKVVEERRALFQRPREASS